MPKEITHWLIAERVTALLGESHLGRAIAAAPNSFRLGAVFLDAIFYLPRSGPNAVFIDLVYAWHGGHGEDTYDLLRRLLAGTTGRPLSGPLAAFSAGMATHLQADMGFHPLIYYLTGNDQHPDPVLRKSAIRRHRFFETMLDMYFAAATGGSGRHSLRSIMAGLEIPLDAILEWVCRGETHGGVTSAGLAAALRRGLRNFGWAQGISRRRWLGKILASAEKFLPPRARELAAICYAPRLEKRFADLRGRLRYRNPVSGEEREDTVEELFEKSARAGASFCQGLEEAILGREPVALDLRGPSLSYALPGVTPADARFFAPEPFFKEEGDS